MFSITEKTFRPIHFLKLHVREFRSPDLASSVNHRVTAATMVTFLGVRFFNLRKSFVLFIQNHIDQLVSKRIFLAQ